MCARVYLTVAERSGYNVDQHIQKLSKFALLIQFASKVAIKHVQNKTADQKAEPDVPKLLCVDALPSYCACVSSL